MKKAKHPIQPLVRDPAGVIRTKENKLISLMLDLGRQGVRFDLNTLAILEPSNEDWCQLLQLLGYSLSGLAENPTVSDRLYEKIATQEVQK